MKRALFLALALAPVPAARADVAELFPDNTAYVVRLNVKAVVAQPTVFGDAASSTRTLDQLAEALERSGEGE